MNFTTNRSGGNAEIRYNWQLDTHNRGGDWYSESIADSWPTVVARSSDDFIATTRNAGAVPAITIPLIEWMPKVTSTGGKLVHRGVSS